MVKQATVYQCTNKACVLGSAEEPGHFTGGATQEQVNLLTGKPVETLVEGTDYGDGFCPNCGKKGKDTGDTFKPHKQDGDPYQNLHDAGKSQEEIDEAAAGKEEK